MKLESNVDGGRTYYQYRLSTDGITFDAWSTATSFDGEVEITINTNKQYMQYRLLYDPVVWSDDQYVYVKEVN